MITDYNRLSGLHKVAILFSVLGESLAMSLIKGLSRTEVRKIRATIRIVALIFLTSVRDKPLIRDIARLSPNTEKRIATL